MEYRLRHAVGLHLHEATVILATAGEVSGGLGLEASPEGLGAGVIETAVAFTIVASVLALGVAFSLVNLSEVSSVGEADVIFTVDAAEMADDSEKTEEADAEEAESLAALIICLAFANDTKPSPNPKLYCVGIPSCCSLRKGI